MRWLGMLFAVACTVWSGQVLHAEPECDPPAPVIQGAVATCHMTERVYKVNAFAGRTYQWTVPARATRIGSAMLDSVRVHWTTPGTDTLRVRCTITATGCVADTFLVVTVMPLPTPSVSGPGAVCKGTTATYATRWKLGTTYSWSAPRLGRIVGADNLDSVMIEWTSVGTDTAMVREHVVNTGCEQTSMLTVVVLALPSPSITGPDRICVGAEQVFRVQPRSGHAYEWSVSSRATVSGSTTASALRLTWQQDGRDTLRVRETSTITTCAASSELVVLVDPSPSAAITGPQIVCLPSAQATYESDVDTSVVASITWAILPASMGTIMPVTNPQSCNVTWVTPGTARIRCTVTSRTGCTTVVDSTVTVVPPVIVSVTSARGTSFCEGDSITLDAGPGFTTYQWLRDSAAVGASRTLVATQPGVYQVEVSRSSCTAISKPVRVVMNERPAATIAQTQPGVLTASTNADPSTVQWYEVSQGAWIALPNETGRTLRASRDGSYGAEVTATATTCVRRSNVIDVVVSSIETSDAATARPFTISPAVAHRHATVTLQTDAQLLDVRIIDARGKCHAVLSADDRSFAVLRLPAGFYAVVGTTSRGVHTSPLIVIE